jgi:hypothetical protein
MYDRGSETADLDSLASVILRCKQVFSVAQFIAQSPNSQHRQNVSECLFRESQRVEAEEGTVKEEKVKHEKK